MNGFHPASHPDGGMKLQPPVALPLAPLSCRDMNAAPAPPSPFSCMKYSAHLWPSAAMSLLFN